MPAAGSALASTSCLSSWRQLRGVPWPACTIAHAGWTHPISRCLQPWQHNATTGYPPPVSVKACSAPGHGFGSRETHESDAHLPARRCVQTLIRLASITLAIAAIAYFVVHAKRTLGGHERSEEHTSELPSLMRNA